MQRRLVMAWLAALAAPRAGAQDAGGLPRFKVSAARLHEAVSARFPLRLGVEDFITLQVTAPRLHLLPQRNRMGLGLQATASGLPLAQAVAGGLDLAFALRYERSDRSLRAHQPEVIAVEFPGLPSQAVRGFQGALPALLQEALGEVVLHRFSDRELALADTMGFEPEKVTVVEDGLLVQFGAKKPPG